MSKPNPICMETELDLFQHLIGLADRDITVDLAETRPDWLKVMRAHAMRRVLDGVVNYADTHTPAEVKAYVLRELISNGRSGWHSADPCDEVIARLEIEAWADLAHRLRVVD